MLKLFRLFLEVVIPIILLLGGIAVLALRIPGWSLLLGLPMVVFSIVFLIYAYDEVVSRAIPINTNGVVKCSVCGKPTPLFQGTHTEDVICPSCQEEISHKLKEKNS